nr:type 1 glutamine amidotransferase domain-containing protein [Micromonospora sp. ALFpr18c]
MPLPDHDFDVTEVAVPWQALNAAGHQFQFTTEAAGTVPAADPRLLTGVILGQLGAADEPKHFYHQLIQSPEFRNTVAWADLNPADYDGLILPGGHAPGMRQYLGSEILAAKVAQFWALGRPVGAICHGVLVLSRTTDPATGRSVLADRRTTCLLKYQERAAYLLTAWKLGRYYRTYPAYVEDEVRAALDSPGQLEQGPRVFNRRGTATDDTSAFVVRDGNYVSARWPGDAYLFAKTFGKLLDRSPVYGDRPAPLSSELRDQAAIGPSEAAAP